MTQQKKQLLLKAICGYLPYGLIYHRNDGANIKLEEIDVVRRLFNYTDCPEERDIKPYLRPMSSMTKKEKDNLQSLHDIISNENYGDGYSPSAWNAITEWEDYCNARHLDYRGLIPMKLALEASEDMYKTE